MPRDFSPPPDRLCRKGSLRNGNCPRVASPIPEIRARLNGNGEEIRSVFQTADEIAYSGRRFTVPDLQRGATVTQQQLLALS